MSSKKSSGNQSQLKQNFQSEKVGEMEVILNYNGLSEWQHFNGVSMNSGCGSITSDLGANSAASASSGAKSDYYFRDSQVVAHQDCILDIGIVQAPSTGEPIMITCGRDGLVKLWR